MIASIVEEKFLRSPTIAIFITIGFLMALIPDPALAKRGGGNEKRSEFYGIVQERPPSGRQGEWRIGGRIFIADQGTEIDETQGPLSTGSCAKVQIRDGRIHEIDSEPKHDCH